MPTLKTFLPGGACLTCVVDTFGGRGYFGTVGGGYDFQVGGLGMGAWNPMIVVGLLADYNFESFKGTTDIAGAAVAQIKETAAWAGGARIGSGLRTESSSPTLNGGATGTRFGGSSLRLIRHRRAGRPFDQRHFGRPAGSSAAAPRRRWLRSCRSACSGAANIATTTSTRRMFRPACCAVPPSGRWASIRWCRRSARRSSINSTGNKRRGTLGDRGSWGTMARDESPGLFFARAE